MKYLDEFRDGELARGMARNIAATVVEDRSYRFMEFCGGHTHAISRYGLTDLLPPQLTMIHGPGCPVCVLPIGRVDLAIELALQNDVILCSYGDTLRVPASNGLSLAKAKAGVGARRADVRMIYSSAEALALARAHPERQVVFFAIGFETTTPPTAVVIRQAAQLGLANFSVLCCHVLTPPAITHILSLPQEPQSAGVAIDGFIGPAHVSTVVGSRPYEFVAEKYRKPVVIAGFEPLDLLAAILMLVKQVNAGVARVENQFSRAVTREGNLKAQDLVATVFEMRREFEWRGLGTVPYSALQIREPYAAFDAERRFALVYKPVADNKACECGAILRGVKRPSDCKVFGMACTPEMPLGSCMVSSEGACAAHYTYGRFRGPSPQPPSRGRG